MFKITPPIGQNVVFRCAALLWIGTCMLAVSACTCGNGSRKISTTDDTAPVCISRSLFHNGDSLAFYARKAYMEDDPQGLYVTGAAAFLRLALHDMPDSCTTVPPDEAEIMLKRAAALGHKDAHRLLQCLAAQGVVNYIDDQQN